MKLSNLLFIPMFVSGSIEAAEIDIQAGWQSQHVSEGRDSFDSGVYQSAFELEHRNWIFAVELYQSDRFSNSWETDFSLGYQLNPLENLSWLISYNRFNESIRGEQDQADEIMNDLGWRIQPWLNLDISHIYKTNDNSSFLVVQLSGDIYLSDRWRLRPYVHQAWDNGYARERYRGSNHAQIGTSVLYTINDQWYLDINGHVSHAMGGVKADRKGDLAWFGVSVGYRY